MTKDEIMHVLRLVALGRINTPEQVAFCEKLERAFADSAPVEVMADADGMVDAGGVQVEAAALLKAEPGAIIPAKRTRKTKAE